MALQILLNDTYKLNHCKEMGAEQNQAGDSSNSRLKSSRRFLLQQTKCKQQLTIGFFSTSLQSFVKRPDRRKISRPRENCQNVVEKSLTMNPEYKRWNEQNFIQDLRLMSWWTYLSTTFTRCLITPISSPIPPDVIFSITRTTALVKTVCKKADNYWKK